MLELGIVNNTLQEIRELQTVEDPMLQLREIFKGVKKFHLHDCWMRPLDFRFNGCDMIRENHETDREFRTRTIIFYRLLVMEIDKKELSVKTCYVLSSAITKKIKFNVTFTPETERALATVTHKLL